MAEARAEILTALRQCQSINIEDRHLLALLDTCSTLAPGPIPSEIEGKFPHFCPYVMAVKKVRNT